MKEIILKKACEIYGDNLPEIVQERINRELSLLKHSTIGSEFRAVPKLAEFLRENKIPFTAMYSTANSFLVYLLGVSNANPLPVHYFCPRCKRFTLSDDAKDGFDLPKRLCDCGSEMVGDGHNLAPEFFWFGSLDEECVSDKLFKPRIRLIVPETRFDEVCQFLEELPELSCALSSGYKSTVFHSIGMFTLYVWGYKPKKSECWFNTIDTKQIRSFAINNYKDFTDEFQWLNTKPKSFYETVKLMGYGEGTRKS